MTSSKYLNTCKLSILGLWALQISYSYILCILCNTYIIWSLVIVVWCNSIFQKNQRVIVTMVKIWPYCPPYLVVPVQPCPVNRWSIHTSKHKRIIYSRVVFRCIIVGGGSNLHTKKLIPRSILFVEQCSEMDSLLLPPSSFSVTGVTWKKSPQTLLLKTT